MLLGYKINVFTDHLNLVHETTLKASDRVMRWILLLEEFSITKTHIKGEDNVVADALSRLDREDPAQQVDAQKAPQCGSHPHHPEVLNT